MFPPKFICWRPNLNVIKFISSALGRYLSSDEVWGWYFHDAISTLLSRGGERRGVRGIYLCPSECKGERAWEHPMRGHRSVRRLRTHPCQGLILDLQPPALWENKCPLLKPFSLWFAVETRAQPMAQVGPSSLDDPGALLTAPGENGGTSKGDWSESQLKVFGLWTHFPSLLTFSLPATNERHQWLLVLKEYHSFKHSTYIYLAVILYQALF